MSVRIPYEGFVNISRGSLNEYLQILFVNVSGSVTRLTACGVL